MTATLEAQNISLRDERILDRVFDAEGSPESVTVAIDNTLPADPHISNPDVLRKLAGQENDAISLVELFEQRPHLNSGATEGDNSRAQAYESALGILDNIVDQRPKYSSAYNNRAQLHRWRYGNDLTSLSSSDPETQAALSDTISDLRSSINLSTPLTTINPKVSPQQAKTLVQAWTQLGAVFWALSKSNTTPPSLNSSHEEENDWEKWDSTKLEEEGSRCFFMAGIYGSEFSRSLSVAMNPYARLCGGIVREALKREGSL